MKWLSLDPSSYTGYAVFKDVSLIRYDQIEVRIKNYSTDVKKYTDLPPSYPDNLMQAAQEMASLIRDVIIKEQIEFVVLEHTEPSKRRFSQRYLEWLHYCLIQEFKQLGVKYQYLLNSDWRKAVKCYLNFWPEYKRYNSQVSKAKRKSTPTKSGAKVAKIDGKVVSSIDGKKLSVIIANAKYELNLPLSSNDIADALNMGTATIELGILDIIKTQGL